ncbi:MAG: mechanosensitive ion channel [Ignavibacteria bacterium]|nr:mechanosensitive ion channel [Bacteroidota bacterium]MBL7129737.1 mechanosensitive ion channel [Ignavibacteria bacterium]
MDFKEILEYKIIQIGDYSLILYHVLFVIFVFIVTGLLLWIVKKIIDKLVLKKEHDRGKKHAIYQIVKYFVWVIAIAIALESIGIKLTLLIAGSAALLVGLGLGLQSVFQDFISGIVILVESTIQVNDVIEVEGFVGRVKEIGLRTSKVVTRDDIVTIIPNSKFTTERVINWSHTKRKTRFHINVGVAYGSDVELVRKVLLECASEHKEVENIPEPFVRFVDFGNSSLDFELFFWSVNNFYVENIKSDLRFLIDKKFRENKIQIPFPQRDIHIRTDATKRGRK